MSSSFGELLGLCHFTHNQVTPAVSSSGGKGGNGTLHEVNRSTTSLNSLGKGRERQRMGENGRKRRQSVSDAHGQMGTVSGRDSNMEMETGEGATHGIIALIRAPTLHPSHFLLRGETSILKLE